MNIKKMQNTMLTLLIVVILALMPSVNVFAVGNGSFDGITPPDSGGGSKNNPPATGAKITVPVRGRKGSQSNPDNLYAVQYQEKSIINNQVNPTISSLKRTYDNAATATTQYRTIKNYDRPDKTILLLKLPNSYRDSNNRRVTHHYYTQRHPKVMVYYSSKNSSREVKRVFEKADWTIHGQDFDGRAFSGGFAVRDANFSGGKYTSKRTSINAHFYRTGKFTITYVPYQTVTKRESGSSYAYGYYYYRNGKTTTLSGTPRSHTKPTKNTTNLVKRNDYFQKWIKIITADDISDDPNDKTPVTPNPGGGGGDKPIPERPVTPPKNIPITPGGDNGGGGNITEDTDVTIVH